MEAVIKLFPKLAEFIVKYELYGWALLIALLGLSVSLAYSHDTFEKKYNDRLDTLHESIEVLQEDNLMFEDKINMMDIKLSNLDGKMDVVIGILKK